MNKKQEHYKILFFIQGRSILSASQGRSQMKKRLVSIFMGLGLVSQGFASDAGWKFYETGYRVRPQAIEKNYFFYKPTVEIFSPYFEERNFSKIVDEQPEKYEALVSSLQKYIIKERDGRFTKCAEGDCEEDFTKINGINYREMSHEIALATFCFGTDPFVTASKIKQESRFDMEQVSNENAFGLTQFTIIGIKEVLDQLGHRGAAHSYLESLEPFKKSLQCFSEGQTKDIFDGFPEIKTVMKSKKEKVYTKQSVDGVVNWLKVKKSSTPEERKIIAKRQILFGQLLLKTYLGYSYQIRKKATMARIYDYALQMYNGDKIKVRYAKQIMRSSERALAL